MFCILFVQSAHMEEDMNEGRYEMFISIPHEKIKLRVGSCKILNTYNKTYVPNDISGIKSIKQIYKSLMP